MEADVTYGMDLNPSGAGVCCSQHWCDNQGWHNRYSVPSRGSTRGSFLRPSKRSTTKGGGKKYLSLYRLESRNKKFFNESLPKKKRTLKQKALDLQKKNKEYARQVKEERKYLKGSKKKRRRRKK